MKCILQKSGACIVRFRRFFSGFFVHGFFVIIQHLLELLMIQSDKLAYLTDLSGSRGADKR